MDRWVFDIGLRVEKILGDISREGSQSFQVNDDPSLAPDLQSVIFGNGDFTIGEVDTSEWALALGALYKLTDNISLYANGARGFFFPEIRSVSFNSLGEPQTFKAEIIKQAEAG
ncbi:hypothetical protein JCM17846_20400 [Iodidimonas nitroreducens]|uniref:TonB-dependent receptor-like beta-barrel domain-containing protein n=1 Tax=Iodidimonas nitroreducens TaxID=1236968 RepID=A0A5A7N8F4_9PROT|nr:hypothetical protein JCM17846_20400 [Iodidimonas nitroreducens]